jgi:flavin reductase
VTGPDPDAFRRATGQFATGIVVIAATVDGVTHAMTVNAFTSVSLEPLLVLACVEKAARFHDAVLAAGSWAISVLSQDAEKTARWLATRGRPLEGQLDQHPHHLGAATGAPILDDALSALECRTYAVHDGGDHSILVGEVLAVFASPAADLPGPLIYHAGRYRRLSRPLAQRGRCRLHPGRGGGAGRRGELHPPTGPTPHRSASTWPAPCTGRAHVCRPTTPSAPMPPDCWAPFTAAAVCGP